MKCISFSITFIFSGEGYQPGYTQQHQAAAKSRMDHLFPSPPKKIKRDSTTGECPLLSFTGRYQTKEAISKQLQSSPEPQNEKSQKEVSKAVSGEELTGTETAPYLLSFPKMQNVWDIYTKMCLIGQGTYGEVFKARHIESRKIMALKRLKAENQKEGFPITYLREIKILQSVANRSEHIVDFLGTYRDPLPGCQNLAAFYLAFEYCQYDLDRVLRNKNITINLDEKKSIMKQLLNGLYVLHSNKIMHRDMKPANILITSAGKLKLADFGLARNLQTRHKTSRFTSTVITLWYRPPELLLGENNYNQSIDMWSVGSIMAELWTRKPIMRGENDQQQLNHIITLCGSINPEVWPGVEKLELYPKIKLPTQKRRRVMKYLTSIIPDDVHAVNLCDQMLRLDPSERIDADKALDHDFFYTDPQPSRDLSDMLTRHNGSSNPFQTGYNGSSNPSQTGHTGSSNPSQTGHNGSSNPYQSGHNGSSNPSQTGSTNPYQTGSMAAVFEPIY